MIKTIRKVFFVWDFEKEEIWLNEMSASGLQLCGVGFCTYHFEEGAASEYAYRLEMLDYWPTHAKSVQYIRFVEETGAEYIGSVNRWVYFRKRTQGDPFEIYSDMDSRISHLNRMLWLVGIFAAANLFNTLNMLRMWIQSGMLFYPLMIIANITFVISAFLGYGFIRIYIKARKLRKEKVLRE